MPDVKTGLVLPPATPSVSPAAPFVLAAAIKASGKIQQIGNLPRTVFNQGTVLCCVSCALVSAMEAINPAYPSLSPLFHYYVTRFVNSGADTDGSLLLESGLETLSLQGICRQDLHAFSFDNVAAAIAPSAAAYDDGEARVLMRNGVTSRTPLLGGPSIAAEMRDELDQDRPVVVAFRLPEKYPDNFLDANTTWSDPNVSMGPNGHCAVIIGYSDVRKAFRVQDSRGRQRFDGGCWWMGYSVVDSSILQSAYSFIP